MFSLPHFLHFLNKTEKPPEPKAGILTATAANFYNFSQNPTLAPGPGRKTALIWLADSSIIL